MNNTNPGAYFPIFIYPHVKLREKVQAVTDFGPDLQKIVDKMAATMYVSGGVGLAAPQVGISLNLFVMDVSEERNNLQVFINTELLESIDITPGLEGCLSFPGVVERVDRANRIVGRTQDTQGNIIPFEASEIEAIAIQHELDHLNGVLIWDKVSKLKQKYIEKTINNVMSKIPGSTAISALTTKRRGGPKRKGR